MQLTVQMAVVAAEVLIVPSVLMVRKMTVFVTVLQVLVAVVAEAVLLLVPVLFPRPQALVELVVAEAEAATSLVLAAMLAKAAMV